MAKSRDEIQKEVFDYMAKRREKGVSTEVDEAFSDIAHIFQNGQYLLDGMNNKKGR